MTEKNSILKNEFHDKKQVIFNDLISFIQKKFETEKTFQTYASKYNQPEIIANRVIGNIENWFSFDMPQNFINSILINIKNKNWDDIVDAFYDEIEFGTSSIRGKMIPGTDLRLIEKNFENFSDPDFNSNILRGTNTINEVNISHYTYGLVNYMKKSSFCFSVRFQK